MRVRFAGISRGVYHPRRADMITELYVRNYGPLKDVVVTGLTPIHAFIGPNDSGKSTLLRAVRVLAEFATWHDDWWTPSFDSQIVTRAGAPPLTLACRASDEGVFRLDFNKTRHRQSVVTGAAASFDEVKGELLKWRMQRDVISFADSPAFLGSPNDAEARRMVTEAIAPARMLRLDPDVMRAPVELLPPGGVIDFANERGGGLAAVLDALRDRDDGSYEAIREQVCELFPDVARLQLERVGDNKKAVAVQLVDGTTVPASGLSEGLLYFLAIATLRHLLPVEILLVEEPENGLHPARIQNVMRALREVAKTTQVLIATHSPLVVNELQPDEVSVVVRKRDVGTVVKRIVDTPNFAERSRVYALGELWLSYANGEDEAPLLEGGLPA